MSIAKVQNRVYPPHLSAKVGDSVEFTCSSSQDVSWSFNGGSLPPNVKPVRLAAGFERYYALTIADVQLNNAGNYVCTGVDEDRSSFESEGILTVTGKFLYFPRIFATKFLILHLNFSYFDNVKMV